MHVINCFVNFDFYAECLGVNVLGISFYINNITWPIGFDERSLTTDRPVQELTLIPRAVII